jgi:hypothetical protein
MSRTKAEIFHSAPTALLRRHAKELSSPPGAEGSGLPPEETYLDFRRSVRRGSKALTTT